ncbi:MAG: tellurite methyltransferase [bacterium]|jgi:tellurite methyltransferase
MLANKEYWQSVYSTSKVPTFPSQFSVFVQSWLNNNDANIIEVGCGNGRDSRFFHQMGHSVTVSDQVICEDLQRFAMSRHNVAAVETSIVDAVESLQHVVDFTKPVIIYSRFFQHAISESDQQAMLQSLSKVLHKDSMLFFEFRLDADAGSPKEFGTTHFRRFQSADEFRATLSDSGFECVYSCEGNGYARYKSEDPHVGRFVAKLAAKGHLRLVPSTSSETSPIPLSAPPVPAPLPTPVATIRVDDKHWLHGVCTNHTTGLVKIRIDDLQLTHVPLIANDDGVSSKFIFRPAHCLISALPAHYFVNVVLPCGTEISCDQACALGTGDGSLFSKLDTGYLVSAKAGYLFKPPAAEEGWREQIFQAYQLAREAIANIDGASDLFVAYGALLGQVRCGDFIAYDDDFDAGILVDANSPAEAAQHYYRIVGVLRERGYNVATSDSHLGNFHLYLPDLPPVDIFLFFYRDSTSELCSYNLAHVCERDVVLPLQRAELAGVSVLVPNQADALLAATYGENWRTPDPYFQWNMTARHDLLKHTYQAASKAVENGEAIPEFKDPWIPQIIVEELELLQGENGQLNLVAD